MRRVEKRNSGIVMKECTHTNLEFTLGERKAARGQSQGGNAFEANQKKLRKSKVCGWDRAQCSETNDYYNKQPSKKRY